jgi:voltage-gated potassium channel Kch
MSGSETPAIEDEIDELPEAAESQIRISIFLALLVLTVFVLPALGLGVGHLQGYGIIVSCLLFCSGVSIAWGRRRLFIFSALVAVVAICAKLCFLWMPSPFWLLYSEGATLAGILTICWTLLLQIFDNEGPVTQVSIQAAIAVYLLFGAAWSNAYLIAQQHNPGSFRSTVALSSTSSDEWLYFSYVTLTTLGYGEITPLSPVARSLAVGEALTGQLFLAVLVARLIGKEMASKQQKINLVGMIARARKKGIW